MTDNQTVLLTVLSDVLNKKEVRSLDLFSGIDPDSILCEAMRIGVFHLIYSSLPVYQSEFSESFRKIEITRTLCEANQSYLWDNIKNYAESHGIDILMLKGIQNREYYPEPTRREMCDIDLMYNYRQKKAVDDMMTVLGFSGGEISMHHKRWIHPTGVVIEMHHSIGERESNSDMVFKKVFNRAEPADGYSHIYRMNPVDTYLHVIQHLHHHIRNGNWTFKQLIDVYVLKKYNTPDSEKVNTALKAMGLSEFERNIDILVNFFFGDKKDVDDKTIQLADFFLRNIKFGNSDVYTSRLAYDNGSKFKYIISALFPEPGIIYLSYPFIDKHRWLLPFGYLIRFFQRLFSDKRALKEKLHIVKNIDGEAAEQGKEMDEFFKSFGA